MRLLRLFVGAGLLLILPVAFLAQLPQRGAAGAAGERSYTLLAWFGAADGIQAGSLVTLAGIPVGAVSRLDLAPESRQIVVRLAIRESVAVPEDSALRIVSHGLFGDRTLRIEPGGSPQAMQDGQAFEFIQDAVILEDVLRRLAA